MDRLAQSWIWWVIAVLLVVIGFAVTRQDEVRRYRVAVILSLLALEGFVWVTFRVNSIIGLVLLAVGGRLLFRLCAPAVSHILAQMMADKVTDMLFGEQQAPLPTMDFQAVRKLRAQSRFQEAIAHLETVLKATPDDFETRFTLATIYAEDLRDIRTAERHINRIQKVATIAPSSREMARQRLSTWKTSSTSRTKAKPAKPAVTLDAYQPSATPNPILDADLTKPASALPHIEVDPGFASHRTVEDLCRAGNYGSAMQMLDGMLDAKPGDLTGWAIKARIHVQYLAQPWQADKAMQRIMNADDILPDQVDAVDQLAEAFARNKEHRMKAGRLWRKLTEMPSVPVEQKVIMLSRLRKWEASSGA